MALTQEERLARRRRNRRAEMGRGEQRMADSPEFRNALQERMGDEAYLDVGGRGHDDPTSSGRYSAAEVKSEFRNRPDGKKVDEGKNSMVNYFQGLVDGGSKFNNKAMSFLEDKGVVFGGGGGGGKGPEIGDEEVIAPLPEVEEPIAPIPGPEEDPTIIKPIVSGENSGGTQILIGQQRVGNVGDHSNIDMSNTQIMNGSSSGDEYWKKWLMS